MSTFTNGYDKLSHYPRFDTHKSWQNDLADEVLGPLVKCFHNTQSLDEGIIRKVSSGSSSTLFQQDLNLGIRPLTPYQDYTKKPGTLEGEPNCRMVMPVDDFLGDN